MGQGVRFRWMAPDLNILHMVRLSAPRPVAGLGCTSHFLVLWLGMDCEQSRSPQGAFNQNMPRSSTPAFEQGSEESGTREDAQNMS